MEKAGLIGLVRMHYLESDSETLGLSGVTLEAALRADREAGLIPFWVRRRYTALLLINWLDAFSVG